MKLLPVIDGHAELMCGSMIDSRLATTRVFWRKKYYDATDEEANDPRPFSDVLADRETKTETESQ